jgi:hypothetical protein
MATIPADALHRAMPSPTRVATTAAPSDCSPALVTASVSTRAASPGRTDRTASLMDSVAVAPALTRPRRPTAASRAGNTARNQ